MKNKGFTIMELMAVIVILGILSTLAVVSVSKYRQTVKEKELVNLHSTIESAYDKYRSNTIMSGGSASKKINFNNIEDEDFNKCFNKYFSDFTYSGNRLTQSDLEGSVFSLNIKGDLLDNASYITDPKTGTKKSETVFVKDGTCLVGSEISDGTSEDQAQTKEIVKSCKENEEGNFIPSQEEILCIKLVVNDEVLINDFDPDKSMQPLCFYFADSVNNGNTGTEEENS